MGVVVKSARYTILLTTQHGHTEVPTHPGYPAYPSETEIITKAATLNGFVSQTPTLPEKTTKKST